MGGMGPTTCELCGGVNTHGGHAIWCDQAVDEKKCSSCSCAIRAHTRAGCYSHGCKAVVGLWVVRREKAATRAGWREKQADTVPEVE